jgi:hypothetical protein
MLLQGPGCVIIVPSRELGVQIVLLVYKLFGGSVNAGIPGEASNMFAYTGPRGLKVSGDAMAGPMPLSPSKLQGLSREDGRPALNTV